MSATTQPPALAEVTARLAAMPAFLDSALSRAGAARHAVRPEDGGFSLVEHACHLRDLESEGCLFRIMRLLAEDGPVLEGFEGDRIAAERDYLSQDAEAAARKFAATRAEVLRVVGGLGRVELAREGEFGGRRITVSGVVAMAAEHDAQHRGEISRLLDRLG